MSNIRVRTTPNGVDKFIKVKLEQDFDFIEVLSLKISQEEVYKRFYSDYGVVVGRVIINNGVGVPNAKVSIFIPLEESDKTNDEITALYPFATLQDSNNEGVRYNLLPTEFQNECHTPVGNFPSKTEILDNNTLLEVYEKYYKYTTTTNKAGDFMLFGVPVGNHMLTVDVDLSDIGIFSQRPYDFIEQGTPAKSFKSSTKFNDGKNLNNLTQLKHQKVGVNVLPFWGESLANEVGITRVDVDLNYNLRPSAIFVGSIFGDNEKNSVNKNCRPRKKLGNLCETVSSEGTVQMIRKTLDGTVEKFDVEGGRVIDQHGAWAYQIPMNLDYMITDEFGNLVPTEDTTRGIPTRTRVRFKISMDNTGGQGRLRTRAKYLVPHNPTDSTDQDFSFGEETSDNHFRDLYWNKIYTVRNHITRIQAACSINCADNRRMVGIKDVDDCVGTKNPFPFNRLDGDFNPLFSILCIILGIIISLLSFLNGILSFINGIRIPVIRVYPFRRVKCIALSCDGRKFAPGCSRRASPSGTESRSSDELHECYKIQLAEALNVYEFDFYNDWVNGTLFSFLLKYKKNKRTEKFCSTERSESNYIVDTLNRGNLKDENSEKIYHGIIKKYEDELFYAPYDRDKEYLLYATDITNLGSVFDCDWQSMPSIHDLLIPTSYQIPPFQINEEIGVTEMANDGNPHGLLFDLTCIKLTANQNQINAIKRICEIGVGLDEDRSDEVGNIGPDRKITDYDIENQFVRDALIFLNTTLPPTSTFPFSSGFQDTSGAAGSDYILYRNFLNRTIDQSRGNSFYFYFGTSPNNSALDKMNSKYFTVCDQVVKPEFIISGITSDVTSISGSNGTIDIEIIGGVEPFTYEWSNGATTQDLTGLTAGQYTVIVTDFNGSSVKRTFTISEPQPLLVDVLSGTTSGVGNSDGVITLNSIIGGSGDYTVTLVGPSGVFTVVNPLTIYQFIGLAVGTYTLTVTDNNGLVPPLSISVEISNPPPLLVSVEFNDSECFDPNNSNIQITVSGGVPPYTVITNGISVVDISGNPVSYSATTLFQEDLFEGTYEIIVSDVIGQIFPTITGNIVIPPQQPFVIDNNILNPYRVRVPIYLPFKWYDFYKNNVDTVIGSVFTDLSIIGGPLYFTYPDNPDIPGTQPGFVVGDVLFVRERTLGCDSVKIVVTADDIV